jgi:hypothetical protein
VAAAFSLGKCKIKFKTRCHAPKLLSVLCWPSPLWKICSLRIFDWAGELRFFQSRVNLTGGSNSKHACLKIRSLRAGYTVRLVMQWEFLDQKSIVHSVYFQVWCMAAYPIYHGMLAGCRWSIDGADWSRPPGCG